MEYSSHPREPEIVRVRAPVKFSEDSRNEISRFATDGDGLSGLSSELSGNNSSGHYVVKAELGPAFSDAMPFDSRDKNLQIQLISLDGRKAILTGEIRQKVSTSQPGDVRAEFAFVADPDQMEQEVDIFVSDPGKLDQLVDNLTRSL